MLFDIDTVFSMGYAGRHIIQRLKKYRLEMGYTQKFVAQLLGLKDASLVSRWERGLKFPNVPNLFDLAFIYRKSPALLYWEIFTERQDEMRKRELKLAQKQNVKKK
jgi:transcriptional regulator with XRE-family HTH domain